MDFVLSIFLFLGRGLEGWLKLQEELLAWRKLRIKSTRMEAILPPAVVAISANSRTVIGANLIQNNQ